MELVMWTSTAACSVWAIVFMALGAAATGEFNVYMANTLLTCR